MKLSGLHCHKTVCLLLLFSTVAAYRTVSIEIVHDETFATEEITEQEVIPTVEVFKGDNLVHVVKLGNNIVEDLNILLDVMNQPMTSSQDNVSVEMDENERNKEGSNTNFTSTDEKERIKTTTEATYNAFKSSNTTSKKNEPKSSNKSDVVQKESKPLPSKENSKLLSVLTGRNMTTVATEIVSTPPGNNLPTVASVVKSISPPRKWTNTVPANRHRRRKRQAGLNMNKIANDDWAYKHTTPADKASHVKEEDGFQVITESDKDDARNAQIKSILIYTGSTLLSVLTFSAIMFCFLRDPKACIIAFGTGCPCCLLVLPCIKKCLDKYLNPAKMVKENLNKYLPGIIVHEDGTIEKYDTTPEEAAIIAEIVDDMMGM